MFKKILATPFVELLGKSSYIFYLIHLGWMYTLIHSGINQLKRLCFYPYMTNGGSIGIRPFEYDSLNLIYVFIVLNAFRYVYLN